MNKKPDTIKNNIIFDIDSASIAAGIFEYAYDVKGGCLSIRELYSLRKKITDGSLYSFEEFWRRSQKVLQEVSEELYTQSLIPIHEIYCNVSSPWASSQKRQIVYSKKKPFIFTQELADELIEKELSSSLKKNLDYHDHDVDLIDRKTIAFRSNGYPARSPVGKEMSDIEIDSLVTVMSRQTKEAFEHIIERTFHRLPTFTSNIFISYFDVQKSLVNVDDAVIIDVAGEMTEVMIVKNDHLQIIGTLPHGIHHILRAMAKMLGVSISKAHKLAQLLYSSHLEKDYEEHIEEALHKSYSYWLKDFYNFCDEASKKGLLPKTIVMKTYGDTMSWFETLLLSSDELSEHMHARATVEVVHLHASREKESINVDIVDPEMRVIASSIALGNL